MPSNDIRTALAKIGQQSEESTVNVDFWVNNLNQKIVSPAETAYFKGGEYSMKSRKRSPVSKASYASEQKKKARKEIELIITPPSKAPILCFGEKGYYPVKDRQVLENRYEIQRMLGNGSYGTVHLAKDRQTECSVAVKIVRSGELYNIASDKEIGYMHTVEYVSRTTSNNDDSNNIVTLFDNFQLIGSHGLHVVMVMELLGPDLLSILCRSNQKQLTLHRIKRFSKNMLEGLNFLHKKCKIMHLDLKPDNLFVTVDPDNMDLSDPNCTARLKIGDFGTSASTNSVVKRTVQTSHYRAPESFLKVQITPAADFWSVGCLMYEMATQVLLFPSSKNELCDGKWYLRRISELLGPVKMRYFERNEVNAAIFQEVFGNQKGLVEKPLRVNWISPKELMREHPMKKNEAEELHELIKGFLAISPKQRLSAKGALKHPFFTNDYSE